MTKLTIENEYVTININVDRDGMTIEEMIDDLIKPALYSLGYHPDKVNEYFYDELKHMEINNESP